MRGSSFLNMNISQILEAAEKGKLEPCGQCPWSPLREPSVGFGVSCTAHGIDWTKENKANSMLIVQDPADTTPHHTGRLCTVHNAENPSDKTAQHNLHLWNAAVSLNHDDPSAGGYLERHYWTNAMLHGASGKTGLRENSIMKAALKSCSNVVAMQILALKPNVVIATGTAAVNSLHEIGVISRNWATMRYQFADGAYREEVQAWRGLDNFTVFGTYHTSATVVNQTICNAYRGEKTENLIDAKTARLPSSESIARFLDAYSDPGSNKRSAGMRYLLNHWLDIGMEVRKRANAKA